MRVLVTGVKGQLGYDVMNELKKQGLTGIGVDVDEMDITDAEACRRVITEAKPGCSDPLRCIYCSRRSGTEHGTLP